MTQDQRDHGGGLDAAVARWGGTRDDWIDLSTGINPEPYPIEKISLSAWTALPDHGAQDRLIAAARNFWNVPDTAAVLAAPGASALIARIPMLAPRGRVQIDGPTYNEHAAAFEIAGWEAGHGEAMVVVHPNNPDGRLWDAESLTAPFTIIDESFCDIAPQHSLIGLAKRPGTIVLKSFGKFWGLAGLRLGFAIGDPALIKTLADYLGPWPVSGPALEVGAKALQDHAWAEATRARLAQDAKRLDKMMRPHGPLVGGTDLFRLYDVGDAAAFQTRLAKAQIWSRIFPYSTSWIRLGLPSSNDWSRLETAL
ncbi:MAG: threonine-phosphate decarboxylase [Pseudomonadota bacterium]